MRFDNLFNLFFLSIPFWIPAAIGLYLVANRRNDLSLMAGLLTLKPILTTPLWFMIISFLDGQAVGGALIALCGILPGASLTVLTLAIFRRLFLGSRATSAMLLIGLDCIRWMNSGLFTAAGSLDYNPAIGILIWFFSLIGLALPTAFSFVALTTTLATNEG